MRCKTRIREWVWKPSSTSRGDGANEMSEIDPALEKYYLYDYPVLVRSILLKK